MNELKKYQFELSIILVLAILKFLVVPVLQWQDQTVEQTQLLQTRLSKAKSLLASKEQLESRSSQITERLEQLKAHIYEPESAQQLKLSIQKQVERMLQNYDLDVSSLGWQNVIDLEQAPLTKVQLEYTFTGSGQDVIAYLLKLSSQPKWADYESLNVNVRRQKPGRLGRMTVRSRVAFYMLNEEVK